MPRNVINDPALRRQVYEKGGGKLLRTTFQQSIILEIDVEALDLGGFLFWNINWQYGRKSEAWTVDANFEVLGLLNAMSEGYFDRNELLLAGEIPFDRVVKKIHVHPEDLERVKDKLRSEGMASYIHLLH